MGDKSDLLAELVAADAMIKEQAKEVERLENELAEMRWRVASRAEVERELKRIRGCIESVRLRIEQRKKDIGRLVESNFNGAIIANKAQWLTQDEWEAQQYRYVERILRGILERTKEPPAVEGES